MDLIKVTEITGYAGLRFVNTQTNAADVHFI